MAGHTHILRPWRATRLAWPVVLAVFLMASALAQAPNWSGVVVHVTDGDTVYVRARPGPAVAVRLLGLDAPEICQAGGLASRDALRQWVLHQSVTVEGMGQDSYGRELARMYLQGQDVGRAMVAQGHAWADRQGQHEGPYAPEQRQARLEKLGLFAQVQPETPRAFRRRHGACHTGP
jgi:micrococcal nuclease